jgi:serine/threonine protein kinase
MVPTMSTGMVEPGEVLLGKYRIEKVLGAGGMGLVAAATHVGLNQRVALKLMLPGKAGKAEEQRARFLREARAAVQLKSQHVTRVFDVGELPNGAPYMVMEYLAGRDLASVLAARGPMSIEDAVECVIQVCEAVGEAHSLGIVHRDLKPANLFLIEGPDGAPQVKVIDFGISKMKDEGVALTQQGVLGSPLYMSPEQIKDTAGVDGRTDVWALGVTLYELLTCSPPFSGETVVQVCALVLHGAPTPRQGSRPCSSSVSRRIAPDVFPTPPRSRRRSRRTVLRAWPRTWSGRPRSSACAWSRHDRRPSFCRSLHR